MTKTTESRTSDAIPSSYGTMLTLINERIDASGIERNTIASELGLSVATLTRKLTGRSTLTIHHLARIASVLGCRPSDLVA